MPRSDDGQYEMVLENRQVLVIFFVAAALCGVFFALGYMVGKNSGTAYTPPQQAVAQPADAKRGAPAAVETPAQTPAQPAAEPKKEEAPPQEAAPPKTETEPPKSTAPEKKDTPPPPPPKTAAAPPAAEGFITLQVAALSKREDAEAMVALLKRKNFPVSLVTNSPDNLFRVQVGPYTSVKDAETVKTRLEQEGFKPIVKK